MKNKKAFTLIELLAVITVLGLIMLIAIPSVVNVLEKNKKETMINEARKIMRVVEKEDKDNKYSINQFKINNKGESSYTNINTSVVGDTSPFDKSYTMIIVQACTTEDTRYYRIFMSDGVYQLTATKGLTEALINKYNAIDISDSTVERYQMVKKVKNSTTSYTCY